jgi:pantetheine-phosphate adenylyltransferase
MSCVSKSVAVFPGSFDPVTHGHLNIIGRGAKLFDRFVIGVGVNPTKQSVFTPEERQAMLREHTTHLPNVEVQTYDCLTVEFARQQGARVIMRGIRDSADLRAELEIATTNLIIGGIETIFLMTSPEHVMTSSTLIRQVVEIGGYDTDRLEHLVPKDVAAKLRDRLTQSRS